MDRHHPFAHEFTRLDNVIERLEAHLGGRSPDDPLKTGDRLELKAARRQRALLQEIDELSADLSTGLDTCHHRLREVERRRIELSANGHAHDLRHADAWWETETQTDYLAYLIRLLEAELQRPAL